MGLERKVKSDLASVVAKQNHDSVRYFMNLTVVWIITKLDDIDLVNLIT